MSASLVLWLPAPPDNANNRGHWSHSAKQKRAYWEQLHRRVAAHLIPRAPAAPIASAEILTEWCYPDRRWHLDPDNALRRLKPVADWLVANGYLAGDTAQHVRWLPVIARVGEPTPPLASVRLTIAPLPASP